MQSLIQNIVEKLKYLPQSKLNEVLDFVEFLDLQERGKSQLDISHFESDIVIQEFETFETLVDDISKELIKSTGENVPLLSDYVIGRTGIYEEHA